MTSKRISSNLLLAGAIAAASIVDMHHEYSMRQCIELLKITDPAAGSCHRDAPHAFFMCRWPGFRQYSLLHDCKACGGT